MGEQMERPCHLLSLSLLSHRAEQCSALYTRFRRGRSLRAERSGERARQGRALGTFAVHFGTLWYIFGRFKKGVPSARAGWLRVTHSTFYPYIRPVLGKYGLILRLYPSCAR